MLNRPAHTRGINLFHLRGLAYRSQAALEILLAAANMEVEALGEGHPETRQTYGNISLAYDSLGDATNAEKYRRLQETTPADDTIVQTRS